VYQKTEDKPSTHSGIVSVSENAELHTRRTLPQWASPRSGYGIPFRWPCL